MSRVPKKTLNRAKHDPMLMLMTRVLVNLMVHQSAKWTHEERVEHADDLKACETFSLMWNEAESEDA